jgi:predicted metal-dependent phosphoesterase TrpH
LMDPRMIMSMCRKKGYNIISVTDHNTIKGSLVAKRYERQFGVRVLIGEEVETDAGDIIGINLTQEIKRGSAMRVLAEIRQQAGISILPHPFRGHTLSDDLLVNVDVVEGFNSRLNPILNAEAINLARKWGKPVVAGSDAHVPAEIGLAETVVDNWGDGTMMQALRNARIGHSCRRTREYLILYSALVKMVKTGQSRRIPIQAASLAVRMMGRRGRRPEAGA